MKNPSTITIDNNKKENAVATVAELIESLRSYGIDFDLQVTPETYTFKIR